MATVFNSQCQHVISIHLDAVPVLIKRLAILHTNPDTFQYSIRHISIHANKPIDLLTSKIHGVGSGGHALIHFCI